LNIFVFAAVRREKRNVKGKQKKKYDIDIKKNESDLFVGYSVQ